MISFASATITVYINETRPIFSLELVEDDGTELLNDNTNFYFQCFVSGQGIQGSPVSPASEEINITTNSTHRWINISNLNGICDSYTMSNTYKGVICRVSENQSFKDWGGEGYMPWAFDDNETGIGHYGWTAEDYPGKTFDAGFRCDNPADYVIAKDHIADCGTICTTSTRATSNYHTHPEIAIPLSYRNNLENTYNITLGFAHIYMDGTNTWNDLTNAFLSYPASAISSVSENSITMLAQIRGDGTLTFDKKTVILIGGDNDNAGLTFINSRFTIDSWGFFQTNLLGTYTDTDILSNADYTYLDSLIASNVKLCGGDYMDNYNSFDGFNLNCVSKHQSRYFDENDFAYNSEWWSVYDYHEVNSGALNETTHFENCTFYNDGTTSWDIQTGLSYVDNCYKKTGVTFDMKNVISNRVDKRLIHRYNYEPPGQICGLTVNYSYHGDNKFTIIDEDGNVISGANVTLSSVYNTYSTITSTNGIVVHDIDFYRIYYNSSNPTYYASTLEMGTYNLTITKTNYKDYSTIVTLSEPQDWTIALEEQPAWNYSNQLAWEFVNNSGIAGGALDVYGNMKIAKNLNENTNSTYINNYPEEDVAWRITDLLLLTKEGALYILGKFMAGVI